MAVNNFIKSVLKWAAICCFMFVSTSSAQNKKDSILKSNLHTLDSTFQNKADNKNPALLQKLDSSFKKTTFDSNSQHFWNKQFKIQLPPKKTKILGQYCLTAFYTDVQNPRSLNEKQYIRLYGTPELLILGLPFSGNFNFTTEAAHTGKHSIKVFSGQIADYTRQLTDISVTPYNNFSEDAIRIAKVEDNLGYFAPEQGEYIVGAWVKSPSLQGDTTIANSYVKITLTDASNNNTTLNLYAKGNIIEGWQRIEEKIEIPTGTKYFKIELISGELHAYFDDIRIHPADGNMGSYVYDNRTLRLMAELDANNYATFYEYSKEGELIRVKKETVKGIQTLKEVRASSIKKPHNGIFNQ